MLGDVLKKRLPLLSSCSIKKNASNAFWIVLRDIAKEEIIELNEPVDSDIIIPLYYDILSSNLDYIPEYFQEILPSNHQERFRVITRNLFSSNAFHPDGLANQKGIVAYKEINESKKGERIVFSKE
jgi:hypothetical protein